MLISDADPRAMESVEYGRIVKETPADELGRLMSGERRAAVLDELVRRMPDAFRPDRARSLAAVVHWRIGGRPDGGADVYQLVIGDGTCTVSPVADGQPHLVFSIDAVDFVRMVTGNANAVALVVRGRLRSSGDMRLTARFPSLFDPPRP